MRSFHQPSRPSTRSQIIQRSKQLFLLMCIIGVAIIGKIIYLQTVKQEELLNEVKNLKDQQRRIPADRGNIFAVDGQSLLATTVPRYEIAIDATIPADTIILKNVGKKKERLTITFRQQLDTLAAGLAEIIRERSKQEYIDLILAGRKAKDRYVKLASRPLNVEERNKVLLLPFFRSREKAGILESQNARIYPFGQMAKRTIGKTEIGEDDVINPMFGVELSFHKYLAGRDGFGIFNKISNDHWQSVETANTLPPQMGDDVITTIDVNLQDIAESALLNKLYETHAQYGTVILMEIATGEIKAIANYGRQQGTEGFIYADDNNYAVAVGTDPGSTFKLASMIAILEKNPSLNLDAVVANCQGGVNHAGAFLRCSHSHGAVTPRTAFELSCNVGFYHMVKQTFGLTRKSEFISYLKNLHLTEPMKFQLRNEAKPTLIDVSSPQFSATTIPWTSIGYESKFTPLEMAAFYNAVANNGIWVKPMIVREIRKENEIVNRFAVTQKSKPFCSEKTIAIVKKLMEGVVSKGTANNIKEGYCEVAGKTGTAQKSGGGKAYREGNAVYTSFIGYFPANKPRYTCSVVIDAPQIGNSLYGNTIAAPVFRQIADKVFAYDISLHPHNNQKTTKKLLALQQKAGFGNDFTSLNQRFAFTSSMPDLTDKWVAASPQNKGSIAWKKIETAAAMPNVVGCVLRDALYLLENKGFKVKYTGSGKVASAVKENDTTVLLTLK